MKKKENVRESYQFSLAEVKIRSKSDAEMFPYNVAISVNLDITIANFSFVTVII